MAPRPRPTPGNADGESSPPRSRSRLTVRRAEPRRWLRYAVLAIGGMLFVNALAGERGYLEYARLRRRLDQAQAELAARRAENARLQRQIRQLKADPAAIEREVREQLGYVKPGEVVFTVRDVPAPEGRKAPAR